MNIVVLCGGLSTERDVSITGGSCVARALRERGHKVILMDLFFGYTEAYADPKEIFDKPQTDLTFSVSETEPDLAAIRAQRHQDNDSIMGDNVIEICRAADVTFLVLHSDEGENGKLQAALDIAGVKYTGSGYLGSALAMNKAISKALFSHHGIRTPAGICVRRGAEPYDDVGFPCVVKPCSGGSSVGTSIVHSRQEYDRALELAFRYEDSVIVESYIRGRELTVGVLGREAMPVIEIIPKTGFYDYKNKYQAGLTEELCPAPLDADTTRQIQQLAVQVHDALMIEAYSRADFIMDESGTIYCIEANTLPGMTPTSLVPRMALEMGMDFGMLCERIIQVSMEKYQ
jgi:D-alanine-D-alanine ligase